MRYSEAYARAKYVASRKATNMTAAAAQKVTQGCDRQPVLERLPASDDPVLARARRTKLDGRPMDAALPCGARRPASSGPLWMVTRRDSPDVDTEFLGGTADR